MCDDWTAIYVDGDSVHQGHELMGPVEFLELSELNSFSSADVAYAFAESVDEDAANLAGCFPATVSELKGKYV